MKPYSDKFYSKRTYTCSHCCITFEAIYPDYAFLFCPECEEKYFEEYEKRRIYIVVGQQNSDYELHSDWIVLVTTSKAYADKISQHLNFLMIKSRMEYFKLEEDYNLNYFGNREKLAAVIKLQEDLSEEIRKEDPHFVNFYSVYSIKEMILKEG